MKALLCAIDMCRDIGASAAFQEWRKREVMPGKRDKAGMLEFLRMSTSSFFHPTSTCKMGIDDMAVVDPQLRVYGVSGLHVADASIMPTVTTGNTNARRVLSLINPAAGGFYGQIAQLDDGANGSYNGLLLSANHRLSRNFSVLLNYTIQKNLEEGGAGCLLAAVAVETDRIANSKTTIGTNRRRASTGAPRKAAASSCSWFCHLSSPAELARRSTRSHCFERCSAQRGPGQ